MFKDFNVQDANFFAWVLAFLMPIAIFIGILLAHIPYVFWSEMVEGEPGNPIWFELISASFGYAPMLAVAIPGTVLSWKAFQGGRKLTLFPFIGFVAFFAWQIFLFTINVIFG